MTYPTCLKCHHTWHGLPCAVLSNAGDRKPAGPCGCKGAHDDDYWNEGDVA